MLIKNHSLRKPNFKWPTYSSVSVPFLINQDAHSLMHRDEQSAWQAGSYSSLTPASVEWCNRTAGLLPFLPLLIPSFPISSPSPHHFFSFAYFVHYILSLSPFLSLPPFYHSPALLFFLSVSLFTQRPMFLCLHYTQLLPSINYLPTPHWLPHSLLSTQ